jgi:hypothetical protein
MVMTMTLIVIQLEIEYSFFSETAVEARNIEKQFRIIVRPMPGNVVENRFDNKNLVLNKGGWRPCYTFFSKRRQILELKSRNDKSITRRYPELLSPIEAAINCKESVILGGYQIRRIFLSVLRLKAISQES